MKTERQIALEWWDRKSPLLKATLLREYNFMTNINSCTGREIEEIWRKEHQTIQDGIDLDSWSK
jgi:hypothetical protein